jgi:penicillin amidase
MNQSYSWDEFREACNYSNIPGENMVWADRDGNIGWQAVGIAPIRNTHSGLVPVMGDGNYEWDGYLPIVDKPNIFNPQEEFFATANQNVTPKSYNKWNAIGFSWSDPYRGDRVNKVLEGSSELNMKDMIDLQVDYHSIPSIKLIQMISHIKMDIKFNRYFKKLLDWDNKIVKDSEEALIYVNWEREIMRKYHEKYVPDEVKEFIDVQLFKIINNLKELTNKERDSFLMEAFISSINELESDFGDKLGSSFYGQDNYKHIKIRHPLELVVNDSISKILGFNSYPRGGNAYTPGSTGSNLSQSSGATFRVIIDTENWDNSLASNAPGQSGNPNSKFYRNLYEDWANDKYFKLLYSKDEILKDLSKKEIFKPN